MSNESYWRKRFLQDKAESVNTAERFIAEKLRKLYEEAGKEIAEEIERFYAKYAKENQITLVEARQRLSRAEFGDIDWDSYCQYAIDQRKELEEKRDSLPSDVVAAMEKEHQEHEAHIRELSAKGNVTRLELLQADINKSVLELYDEQQINLYGLLSEQYEDGFYKGMFNLHQKIGIGKNFATVNTRAVAKVLLGNQKRNNYSKTLYQHKKKLTAELKECLAVGMIKGESIDKLSRRLQRRLDVSASSARRLARTETAYVYEQATMDAYQECDVTTYEYLATLDMRTSEICRELDGKHFSLKDAVPGTNFPPMHPNCRSTTVPVFDGEVVTKRLAKDGKGKYYEVPSNMNHKEWNTIRRAERNGFEISPEESKQMCSDVQKWVEASYKPVRDYFQTGNDMAGRYEKIHKSLEKLILASPKYEGSIYRGIANDRLIGYTEGEEISMKGISSWSKDIDVAEMFANQKSYGQRVVFILKSAKKAADVSYISEKKYEKEVLLSSKSRQRIKKVENRDGIQYVELEEV